MHDIVVVSDLHLGRGRNPETGRYHRLEAFFYDDDFARFCRWLCGEAAESEIAFKLVLNGDTFDLLRIDPEPAGPGATHTEKRYGPLMTPSRAAETVRDILAGHAGFTAGLGHVLLAGYPVVVLPGNHDPEIQWTCVQEAMRAVLVAYMETATGSPEAARRAAERLVFEPWFHHEPGRVWIEHGCQYDPDNASRYPLRTALGDDPDAVRKTEPDLPMGSFFQRYLYNAFGSITFIVPNSRSNARYFRWLLFNQPRLLARVSVSHGPFFLQVIRRIAKAAASTATLRRVHRQELAALAEQSGLGERLLAVDRLKNVHGSAAAVTYGLLREGLKATALMVAIAFLGAGLWFAGFHAINEMRSGFGLKAVLFLGLNFLFLSGTLVGLLYSLVRVPTTPSTRPLQRTARAIARVVDVPIVTFGHSHEEVVWRVDRSSEPARWYYNTGTWIAVFAPDELVPRERVQYTFLRIRGHEARLMHWSPGREEALPVILLDDGHHAGDIHPAAATVTLEGPDAP